MMRSTILVVTTMVLAACSSGSSGGNVVDAGVEEVTGLDSQPLDWGNPDGGPLDPPDSDATILDGASEAALPPDASAPDASGDGAGDTGVNQGGWHLRIVSPVAGDLASGAVRVRIEPVEATELEVDSLVVSLGTTPIFTDTKLPTEFVLDTAAHPNGSLALGAVATVGATSASDQVTITAANPDFGIVEVVADRTGVVDEETVTLEVDAQKPGLTVTADFAEIDSGFVAAAGQLQDAGNGRYTLQYTVSAANALPDGVYTVPVTATDGVSSLTARHLRLTLSNTPQNPLRLDGAIFVSGVMPVASPGWAPPLSPVSGNDFIITGGSAKLTADFSGYPLTDELVGILVGVEGMSGYFQKPLSGSSGVDELLLLLRTYAAGETAPAKLTVQVALKDIRGRVSPMRTHDLVVQAVGNGDVQVSISWDSATDVDLHVVEPGGCELYYGKKTCPSGGWLDLDSNPACLIDNLNNENVFWPAGQAPLGTYKVRVDYYDDCGGFFGGGGKPANYTVTLRYCGTIELVSGAFTAGSDDKGGAGDGNEVATFNNEACARPLHGRLRFQDHVIDRFGTGAWLWKPVRFATVEVVRVADDVVLATTTTDRAGDYEASFTNTGAPGVALRISTRTNYDDGLREILVMNHPKFKKVYSVVSPTIDETAAQDLELDVDISEADTSGAFNILDVVSDGYDTIRLMTGTDLGELVVYWATGANTTDTLFCSKYFYDQGDCSELNALSVQGKDTDRDEFDDMVILKEFFKFALARCSLDDSPGGAHDGTRDDPRRSWTEGVSTFFACDALATPWFVNSRPSGVYLVSDLETIDSPFAFSTSPSGPQGDLSEFLVSSLLWDLADGPSGEAFDAVDGMRLPIYDSIFNYLPGSKFQDRGVQGVDLIDFIDGWVCRAWGDEVNVAALMAHYLFGYTVGGPTDCFVSP